MIHTKVTCQQYACYRLNAYMNRTISCSAQAVERSQAAAPSTSMPCICSAVSQEQLPRLKDSYSHLKPSTAEGHTLSLSCGAVSCFTASNKQRSLCRGCYLPLSTDPQTGELQHTSPAG